MQFPGGDGGSFDFYTRLHYTMTISEQYNKKAS